MSTPGESAPVETPMTEVLSYARSSVGDFIAGRLKIIANRRTSVEGNAVRLSDDGKKQDDRQKEQLAEIDRLLANCDALQVKVKEGGEIDASDNLLFDLLAKEADAEMEQLWKQSEHLLIADWIHQQARINPINYYQDLKTKYRSLKSLWKIKYGDVPLDDLKDIQKELKLKGLSEERKQELLLRNSRLQTFFKDRKVSDKDQKNLVPVLEFADLQDRYLADKQAIEVVRQNFRCL